MPPRKPTLLSSPKHTTQWMAQVGEPSGSAPSLLRLAPGRITCRAGGMQELSVRIDAQVPSQKKLLRPGVQWNSEEQWIALHEIAKGD